MLRRRLLLAAIAGFASLAVFFLAGTGPSTSSPRLHPNPATAAPAGHTDTWLGVVPAVRPGAHPVRRASRPVPLVLLLGAIGVTATLAIWLAERQRPRGIVAVLTRLAHPRGPPVLA